MYRGHLTRSPPNLKPQPQHCITSILHSFHRQTLGHSSFLCSSSLHHLFFTDLILSLIPSLLSFLLSSSFLSFLVFSPFLLLLFFQLSSFSSSLTSQVLLLSIFFPVSYQNTSGAKSDYFLLPSPCLVWEERVEPFMFFV